MPELCHTLCGGKATRCARSSDVRVQNVVPVTFSFKANLTSISKKEKKRSGERKFVLVLMFVRNPPRYLTFQTREVRRQKLRPWTGGRPRTSQSPLPHTPPHSLSEEAELLCCRTTVAKLAAGSRCGRDWLPLQLRPLSPVASIGLKVPFGAFPLTAAEISVEH